MKMGALLYLPVRGFLLAHSRKLANSSSAMSGERLLLPILTLVPARKMRLRVLGPSLPALPRRR